VRACDGAQFAREDRVDERSGAEHHHVGAAREPTGGVAPHHVGAGRFDHERRVFGQTGEIGKRRGGLTARAHVDGGGFGIEPADRGNAR